MRQDDTWLYYTYPIVHTKPVLCGVPKQKARHLLGTSPRVATPARLSYSVVTGEKLRLSGKDLSSAFSGAAKDCYWSGWARDKGGIASLRSQPHKNMFTLCELQSSDPGTEFSELGLVSVEVPVRIASQNVTTS